MHVRLYSKEEITEVIKRAGLKIVYLQTSTHYCILFNHLFLNGMKRLLNIGILPKAINNVADKFKYKENKRIWLNPVSVGHALFNFIDRRNESISEDKSSVAIAIKAIKRI